MPKKTKPKLPKQLTVLGHVFDVKLVPFKELRNEGDQMLYGQMGLPELEIKLSDDQEASLLHETLLHEAFHAVVKLLSMTFVDYKQEEDTVQQLAMATRNIMRDNPKFVAMVMGQ